MQRFLLSRSTKQLVNCIKVVVGLDIFFVITISLIGFLVRVKAPNIDPSTSLLHFIANYLCIGVKGLVIAGLLAVTMSTADSWLNTTSILIAHDIIKKLNLYLKNEL